MLLIQKDLETRVQKTKLFLNIIYTVYTVDVLGYIYFYIWHKRCFSYILCHSHSHTHSRCTLITIQIDNANWVSLS